jgi:hypothetical protein
LSTIERGIFFKVMSRVTQLLATPELEKAHKRPKRQVILDHSIISSSHHLTTVKLLTDHLIHFDGSPRSVVAPVTLQGVSLDTGVFEDGGVAHTLVSEDASLSSRQYSFPHDLHWRMNSSLQVMHCAQ